jgi:hypothetical protein
MGSALENVILLPQKERGYNKNTGSDRQHKDKKNRGRS